MHTKSDQIEIVQATLLGGEAIAPVWFVFAGDEPQPSHAAASDGQVAEQFAPLPGEQRQVRVLLADDHKIMRQGLVMLLQEEPDILIVGEAADGQQAIELARAHEPDVVVMDVTMPVLNGIEATRQLTAEMPEVRVIGLSMHETADMAAAMREAGAVNYVAKGGPLHALTAAIRDAAGRLD